jgi:hypothetical protein
MESVGYLTVTMRRKKVFRSLDEGKSGGLHSAEEPASKKWKLILDLNTKLSSKNCSHFLLYEDQVEGERSWLDEMPLESPYGDHKPFVLRIDNQVSPAIRETLFNLFKQQKETQLSAQRFVDEYYLKRVGDFNDPIPKAWTKFMIRYFEVIEWTVHQQLRTHGWAIAGPNFTPDQLWSAVLHSNGHRMFESQELKTEFFTCALSAFYHCVLGNRARDLPRIERGAIYMLDPVSRHQQRLANWDKACREGSPLWFFFDRTSPVLFLQEILTNRSLLEEVPLDYLAQKNPISETLRIVLGVFELGLIQAEDCDMLLTTIDCFVSLAQKHYQGAVSGNFPEDTRAKIKFELFKSRQIMLEILLHMTSLYCDSAFMVLKDRKGYSSDDRRRFLFGDKVKFKNMAHVLVKFCGSVSFEVDLIRTLINDFKAGLESYKRDWVTLLTLLNDNSYDHFVMSWGALMDLEKEREIAASLQKDRRRERGVAQIDTVMEVEALNAFLNGLEMSNYSKETLNELAERLHLVMFLHRPDPSYNSDPDGASRFNMTQREMNQLLDQNNFSPQDYKKLPKFTASAIAVYELVATIRSIMGDLQRSEQSIALFKKRSFLHPYIDRLRLFVLLGRYSREEIQTWATEFTQGLRSLPYTQDHHLKREFARDFLRKRSTIDPQTIQFLRDRNIPHKIGTFLANFHLVTTNVWSSTERPASRAINLVLMHLSLVIQQDPFLKASLFYDSIQDPNFPIFSQSSDYNEVITDSYQIPTATRKDQSDPASIMPPPSLRGWTLLCFFQPLNFAKFMESMFSGDFNLFLHEKTAYLNLLEYYQITFLSFSRALSDQWNTVSRAVKEGVRPPNLAAFREQLADYESALYVWNRVLHNILKEISNRNNYSKGYHYFSRVTALLIEFVHIFSFSDPLKMGNHYEAWGRALHSGPASDANPAHPDLYQLSPKTKVSFLKLLNISMRLFWKVSIVSNMRSNFMVKAAKVFGAEITEAELPTRCEFFRLYDTFFNFEKNTMFDEFVLWTINPDISLIKEKFRPEDFNAIYKIENVEFLIDEARRICEALRASLDRPTLEENRAVKKLKLIKYAWEFFMPALYKLLKGVTVSYYTKIKNVNFKMYRDSIRNLVNLSQKIAAMSLYYLARESGRQIPGVNNQEWEAWVYQAFLQFALLGDNHLHSFSAQTVATKSNPLETSVRDSAMEEIRTVVISGLDGILIALGSFFSLSQTVKEDTRPNVSSVLITIDGILNLFHDQMWRLESNKIRLSADNISSFCEFDKPSYPSQHWSSDASFLDFLTRIKNVRPANLSKRHGLTAVLEALKAKFQQDADREMVARSQHNYRNILLRERMTRYPVRYHPFIEWYLQKKAGETAEDDRKQSWGELFDSSYEKIASSSGANDTEREESLNGFCLFLIDFSKILNFYVDDVELSLSYFDSTLTNYNLAWEYFMKNVSRVHEGCNQLIDRLNQEETERRNMRKFDHYGDVLTTTHENFYELYFNLLNLMYWRIKDQQFKWMYKQFVALNQLIRTINNVKETASNSKSQNAARVRNPIDQILLLLQFLTENSRLFQNKSLGLNFSDRAEDLPLYTVLLSNLSFSVKSYSQPQIDFDSIYFKYLDKILTRQVVDRRSQLYAVQYNGMDSVQSFLLKSSPESLTKIWNSFDFIALYNQMIWLVKFWYAYERIKPRLAARLKQLEPQRREIERFRATLSDKNKKGSEQRVNTTGLTDAMSQQPASAPLAWKEANNRDVGIEETWMQHNKQLLEELMDEEMIGFWDNFSADVSFWSFLNFSPNASDAVLNFLATIYEKYFLIQSSHMMDSRSLLVIKDMSDEYCKISKNTGTLVDQSLKTAAEIFIFLRYLSSNVRTVQNFMEEKEARARKFKIKKQNLERCTINSIIAENKALLFLKRIVRRIEIVKPISAGSQETLLTSIYFRCHPLSFFRSSTIAEEFLQDSPFDKIEARRTYLLEQNDDLILDLKKYNWFYRTFWPLYLVMQPSALRLDKSVVSVVCLVLNVLMVVFIEAPPEGSSEVTYNNNGGHVITVFKILFMVTAGLYFLLMVLNFVFIRSSKVVSNINSQIRLSARNHSDNKHLTHLWRIPVWAEAIWDHFWFSAVMVICAFLGYFVNYVFLTLAFMTVVLELRYFRYIAQAVIVDLKKMGLLFGFLIILLVCCAYLLMTYFGNDPKSPTLQEDCQFYIGCFFNTFNKGYRAGGGMGDIMTQVVETSTDKFWASFFFTIIYFLLVKQILFNIVFGIIQDNFSDSRSQQESMSDRANYCPICDTDIWSIERGGGTFERHVKRVHNLWAYQDYLIYLKASDYGILTEYDVEIMKKNERFDFSWMPQKDWLPNSYRPKKLK